MTIRPATPQDVPAVLPMVHRIIEFHQALDSSRYAAEPGAAEMYRNWLESRAVDERSVFLVAEPFSYPEHRKLAGFLVGAIEREVPIYRLKEYGVLHDLWVEEQYRNEGIARQLLTLAIERFTFMGLRQVRLHAADRNSIAQSLFERCGFHRASVEMTLDLEPA